MFSSTQLSCGVVTKYNAINDISPVHALLSTIYNVWRLKGLASWALET